MCPAGPPRPPTLDRSPLGIPILVFLVVFAVHVQSPVITSYDSRWTIYTAMSLVRHANLDLDEYADLIRRDAGYGTERVGGHIYSVYPVGPVLLAAPLVGLADLACRRLMLVSGCEGRETWHPGMSFIASEWSSSAG